MKVIQDSNLTIHNYNHRHYFPNSQVNLKQNNNSPLDKISPKLLVSVNI